MKLSKITLKPQLIPVVLDDEETVKEYGESLEFWTWDRQPMPVFIRLATATQADIPGMIDIITKLVLEEDGSEIITDDKIPPNNILMKVVNKVTESLGK
jgi:hypothetical protein